MYDHSEENVRHVGEYILLRTDPYGMWIVLDQKGKVHKNFKGENFTSASLAAKAVKLKG